MQTNVSSGLLAASLFAARAHRAEKRKDRQTPYINHPLAVAELLARIGGVEDLAVLQAALLHDTVEDSGILPEQVEGAFGRAVRDLVLEVTDDMSLPQPERRRLQVEHAPHLSPGARMIKIADKICNLSGLRPDSPPDWTEQQRREYLDWAEQVAAGCHGVNPALDAHFEETLRERRAALGFV